MNGTLSRGRASETNVFAITCAFLIPTVLAALLAATQGAPGVTLSDEGFLWYGAQAALRGEVPIRDFMAFDPARYYWSVTFFALRGDDGLSSLRMAGAAFQCVGLAAALALLLRTGYRAAPWLMLIALATVLAWMLRPDRAFEYTACLILLLGLANLIEKHALTTCFLAGMAIGIAAVIGHNHGAYGAIAGLAAIAYVSLRKETAPPFALMLAATAVGGVLGYSPMLAAFLASPDFFSAFLDGLKFYFEYSGTNLSLPIPWTWLSNIPKFGWRDQLHAILLCAFFVGAPAVWVAGAVYALKAPRASSEGVFMSSLLLSPPYLHYVFSRADIQHLAYGVFPALFLLFAVAGTRSRFAMVTTTLSLFLASLLVTIPYRPHWVEWRDGGWAAMTLGRDRVSVAPAVARDIAFLDGLVSRYAPDGGAFLVVPNWPGAYAIFNRRSPMWENYALFPRGKDFEDTEIERIRRAAPKFVVVLNFALDGMDERRFSRTHPRIYAFIKANFQKVAWAGAPPKAEVYRPRDAPP